MADEKPQEAPRAAEAKGPEGKGAEAKGAEAKGAGPEPQGTQEESKEKKPLLKQFPKKVLIMAGGAVVIVIASYFLVSTILRPNLNKLAVEREAEAAKKQEEVKKPEAAPPEVGFTYAIENVLVNPNEPGARRFLRVGIAFEAESQAVVEELKGREMQIRDLLITQFSSCTLAELTDPILKQHLRKQLLEQINELLTSGVVKNMFYTDYVIQ